MNINKESNKMFGVFCHFTIAKVARNRTVGKSSVIGVSKNYERRRIITGKEGKQCCFFLYSVETAHGIKLVLSLWDK